MKDFSRQQIQNRLNLRATQAIGLCGICRYLMVAAAMAALVISYPWVRSEIITLGYQIQELKRDNALLREQQKALMLEQAAYRAPHRIDQYARERLGLVPASSAQVIFVHDPEVVSGQRVLAEYLAPRSSLSKETRQ